MHCYFRTGIQASLYYITFALFPSALSLAVSGVCLSVSQVCQSVSHVSNKDMDRQRISQGGARIPEQILARHFKR